MTGLLHLIVFFALIYLVRFVFVLGVAGLRHVVKGGHREDRPA